jgi:amino acid transporter
MATAVGHEAPLDKGLKTGALGFVSSVVIGVASTAPGYSLAASLGLVTAVAGIGLAAPAIMWLAFVPMLFVAAGYYYLNKTDPDCGTTFSWATRAFGPVAGWLGGWAIVVADVIVMANLAAIAGSYSFLLFGANGPAASKWWVLGAGVIWIAVMTLVCYVGIEFSARTQWFLLGAELVTLALFAIVALVKVYTRHPVGAVHPAWSWLNPFEISSTTALTGGLLVAVFIYWGWDTLVAVNEETEDAARTPGVAAVVSTILLLGIYVVVAIAAQAFHGAEFLTKNANDVLSALGKDVLGSPWNKLLIIAVLTSASASTQTTILPTARTTLSMAAHGALPRYFARIHPRFRTPGPSTLWMGVLSIAWYVGLTIVSANILTDSIDALGLMIAFYYGLTGFACAWYYRRHLLDSARNFLLVGVIPVSGGAILTWLFVKSIIDLSNPANTSTGSDWAGLGAPIWIAIGSLVLGLVIAALQWRASPVFFRRRPETGDPSVFAESLPEPAVASLSV